MSSIFDDLYDVVVYGWIGRTRPDPTPPPPPKPPAPPVDVESLPVSCLVLGIVKSIEANGRWTWANGFAGRVERVHESGMRVVYPQHSILMQHSILNDCARSWQDLPHHTSSGHTFNEKEARLIEDAFETQNNRDTARYLEEERQRAAKANQRFVDLGCPPSIPISESVGVPFRTTITLTIDPSENNRKLLALLHSDDPVVRKAAEDAAVEMFGDSAMKVWRSDL